MKKIWTGPLATAMLVLTCAAIHAGAGPAASSRDAEFVQAVCDDTLMVQRIGELAGLRGLNPQVKQLGTNLAADYGNARRQFSDMAKTMAVPIAPELSARAAHAVERLRSISGAGFDKAALRELVKSEQAVSRRIEDESNRGDNPALKQLAATILPRLQDDIYPVVTLEGDLK